jgi:glycosyltransferase involved in cell wall biosynthesis
MKHILFVSNVRLKDPIRGTPLRIYNFLNQIQKEHILWICAAEVPGFFQDFFIPYPTQFSRIRKLIFFKKIIKEKRIDIVLTATESNIRLPILLKWLTGVKIVIDIHGLRAEELYFEGEINKLKKLLLDLLIKFYLYCYDHIFVVSEKLKSYYSIINKNITVIYGGVNLFEFLDGTSEKLSDTNFVIGYMGNLRPYQGLDYLLEAVRNIKEKKLFDFRLNLVIHGDEKELVNKLKEFNLRDITDIHFNVPHKEVYEIISKSSVLVIPRPSLPLTEYAYPSKLPEMLAIGKPVILTNVGPVRELLKDTNFSIIISSQNISYELENALIRVFKLSQSERFDIGQSAIEFVKNNLTWDLLGKKINMVLEKI